MVPNNKGRRTSGRLKDPPPEVLEEGDESTSPEEEAEESAPKFQAKQKVYARDASSSLWYEAIIRRSLYGVNHNKQVQIGLVSSESEIEEILAQAEAPGYHYFVHYNKWNTNWDRWVSEEDIMEESVESKKIADRYLMEHKKLQKEMKKGKGRGDGTAFLNAWSKRMDAIAEEIKNEAEGGEKKAVTDNKKKINNSSSKVEQQSQKASNDTPEPSKPKPKKRSAADKWDKAAIAREYKLRLRGLEGKRTSQDQHKMTLPFSLKKVMVEAWEIITQCQMVPNLPAKVTVRQGLDKYLQSKLELIVPITNAANPSSPAKAKKSSGPTDEEEDPEQKLQKRRQEWIDMVKGITMFFDDALPFRLLYSQELSQYKIAENKFVVPVSEEEEAKEKDQEASSAKTGNTVEGSESGPGNDDNMQEEKEGPAPSPAVGRADGAQTEKKDENVNSKVEKEAPKTRKMLPSEIYGCEHLLRLCLKVPELLAQQMPTPQTDDEAGLDALAAYEQECKQILAKINDLIRFLHQHQSTVFADSYRKLNEAELREDQKFLRNIRKRKRSNDEKPEASNTPTKPEETAGDSTTIDPPEVRASSTKAQKVS